ncbi:proteasome subunit beta type-1-like isoform X2 [Camellia sinensis]|uniref:proteasome subunit beta type-1-like isoform X2 n=1 Tax=Camellia sinensis TaxID=4442 RepID=UPI0010368056|nr:proteasome subunit beta type-1-like isoform X2 [Camellia sinensis]
MTASFGFQADVRALQKVLAARNLIHQHQHNKQMSCPGKGCVFTYDVVGSHERVGYSSQGSGSTLTCPGKNCTLDMSLSSQSSSSPYATSTSSRRLTSEVSSNSLGC